MKLTTAMQLCVISPASVTTAYGKVRKYQVSAQAGRSAGPCAGAKFYDPAISRGCEIVELAARYSNIETVLEVPRMGLVTAAFKDYSCYLRELCCGLQPPCSRQAFVDAVGEVRNCVWKTY